MLHRHGLLLALAMLASAAFATPLPMREIAPGVFVHQGVHEEFGDRYHGDIANIGFVIGTQAVAVIDTGGSLRIGAALREAVRARTALPILYVINTHVHSDHIFGNAAFAADGPEFIGHANLPRAMRARAETYTANLHQMLGEAAEGSRIVLPTHTVTDTRRLDLGGRTLVLRAWPPAHTDHDLTVMDEATGSVWLGDLLFVERTPTVDGDAPGWLSVMQSLASLPVRQAIPGHGAPASDWLPLLARQRRYLEQLLADLRRGIAEGRGMQQTIATAAASERANWLLFDSANLRNATVLYPLLEWE